MAFLSIANSERVVRVSPSVSAPRLARLLGEVPRAGSRPAYRALADGIKTLLADGRLAAGTRLPSERSLTDALGCSRTTVSRAYAVLRDERHLASRRGSGSFATLPADTVAGRSGRVLSPAVDLDPGAIDLTCAATRAPAGLADAYAAALAVLPSYLDDNGYAPVGLPELRSLVAARYVRAGVDTAPEQIVITSGAVAGLAVVARALVRPGDRVVTESPTYPNAAEALGRAGARIVTIPVDPSGWDLPEACRIIRRTHARAAYLIPDFHNPTGALLADDGRAELAGALQASGTVPVIDEAGADLDLDPTGPRPRPFAHFAAQAITIGSAAKSFWGGLRIGWLRIPRGRGAELVEARATLDLGAPVLEQLVLAELLRRWPSLPPGRREDLVAAREATLAALRDRLPDARVVIPRGGLSLWVEIPDVRAAVLCGAAEDCGLLIAAGPRFSPEGQFERFVRIPYVLPEDTMSEAVHRLATARAAALRPGEATSRTSAFIV